jgi:ribosome-binding factor A
MATRRVARVSQALLESVSSSVLFQLRDPRIKNVTVVRTEVAEDLRTAKVYVSVRGSDRDRALCLQGLDSSRGFLQKKIADRIQTRFTPVLKFVLDDDLAGAAEATRILDELAAERGEADDRADDGPIANAELGDSDAVDATSPSSVDVESEDGSSGKLEPA